MRGGWRSPRLALAAWVICVPHAPAELVALEAGLVLGRVRWQSALHFTLWKSHGHIAASRRTNPWRIVCDVVAKLLAMLLQHGVALLDRWGYPDRSLVQAAQTVQQYALQLATGLRSHARTVEILAISTRCLTAGCRMHRRTQQPNIYQVLLAVTESA